MRRKLIGIGFFWLLGLVWAQGQDCSCIDSGNCPIPITTNSTGQVCYTISDALNNDLADPAQGICGVQVNFTHQHIWNLELWLEGPNGQIVQLIGPQVNAFGTTNNVQWSMLFIPCAFPPEPDIINGVTYEGQWNNNQNWPFAANFTGSYHPYDGCLEDFAIGAVNGDWCLNYSNLPSTYSGQILNFEIILCDNSGILCCEALGGSLSNNADLTLCEGDAGLALDFIPSFAPFSAPDTTEYAYTFLVSDAAGVVVAIDTLPDLTGYVPGTYEVCGLSYRLDGTDSIPVPNGVWTLDSLEQLINGFAPTFCGDLSTSCVAINIVAPPDSVVLNITLCEGETYDLNGNVYDETGTYTAQLLTPENCDSVVTLNLTMLSNSEIFLTDTLCFGDIYSVGDSLYSETGLYETVLTDQLGCDSIVWLNLYAFPELDTMLVEEICAGEAYALGDSIFQSTGVYNVLLSSVWGCDSLVELDLTVLEPEAVIALPEVLTCDLPEVLLDGSGSTPGQAYSWFTQDGSLSGPTDEPTALAQSSGSYELIVSIGACADTASVEVIVDLFVPIPDAGQTGTLICSTDSISLMGDYDPAGLPILVQWSTADGMLLSGDTTLTPWVADTGTYTLTLLNSNNGCTASASVSVQADVLPPTVNTGMDQTITCTVAEVLLDGSASSQGNNYTYTWTNAQGDVLNPAQEQQVAIGLPGWYFLEVLNSDNDCVGLDSVLVSMDTLTPIADAGDGLELTCSIQEVTLGGGTTSAGSEFLYLWQTNDGVLTGDVTAITTETATPGTYTLTVTNSTNGCVATDSVQVLENTVNPIAIAGSAFTLNCNVTSWQLGDPGSSQGADYAYFWMNAQGDTIATTLQIDVSEGGLYELTVLDTLNGCTAQSSVLIGQNQVLPMADAGMDGMVDCADPIVTLGGANSSSGVFIQYAWYDSGGNLLGQEAQLNVNQGGGYCLVVTNGQNFCADTACVNIVQDQALPNAQLSGELLLDCETGTAMLDGAGSSQGADISYVWTGPGGILPVDPTDLQVIVNEAGMYELEVFDSDNACSNFAYLTVGVDTTLCTPAALAGANGIVNCYQPFFDTLDASGSTSGSNIVYSWEALSGEIFTGAQSEFPVVGPGIYVLTVTNTNFGFSATDTVQVLVDFTLPIASAGSNSLLDCQTLGNDFNLDGTGSSLGFEYEYLWSTDGGNIVSGDTTLAPVVNLPGLYDLQVLNTLNGCFATDAVFIDLDGDLPNICLPETLLIPCGIASAILADTCGQSNPNYVYSWSVEGGTILGDPTLPQIEVSIDSTLGVFSLFVTDTSNFCVILETVDVVGPLSCFPDCEIAVPDTLTCDVTQIVLDAQGSSEGSNFTYTWTALSGSLCSPNNGLQACADAPGLYRLTVTDISTNFTCSEDVLVVQNLQPPTADSGPDVELNCAINQVELDGSGSSSGAHEYQWEGPAGAGCVVENAQNSVAYGNCPGWYQLEVRSTVNGCTDVDSTWVGIDTLSPVAVLTDPDPITCGNGTSVISGTGSTQGPGVMYTWTLNGGFLVSSPSAITYQASQTGVYCLTVLQPSNGCQASTCVTLDQDETLPQVFVGPPNLTYTCMDTIFSLQSTVVGNSFYTYAWSTVDGCLQGALNQPNATAVCSGTYELLVTDLLNNCSVLETVTVVDQSELPIVDAGGDLVIDCAQPSVVLDGSNSEQGFDLIYSWLAIQGSLNGPTDQLQADASSAGVYELTVSNSFTGCSASDTVSVSSLQEYPIPDAGAGGELTCAVGELQLNGSGSSGPNPLNYQWTASNGGVIENGADTPMPLISGTGTYILTVTDQLTSCAATDSVWVTGDFVPPQAMLFFPASDVLTCADSVVEVVGNNSMPFGALDFFWTNTAGILLSDQDQLSVSDSGMYWLIVESEDNGCRDTLSFDIGADFAAPFIQIEAAPLLSCAVDSVGINALGSSVGVPFTNSWTGPVGAIVNNPATLTPTVYEPGEFELEITNLVNGCKTTAQVVIQIDTMPPVAVASVDRALSCDNPEVTLSALGSSTGPDINYQWSGLGLVGAGAGANPGATIPGWYVLEVISEINGCRAFDSVLVEAVSLPIFGLEVTTSPPVCPGDTNGRIIVESVLGGLPPYVYSLNEGIFSGYNRFNYLGAGSYFLKVEDSQGCEWEELIELPDPPPLDVELGPDHLVPIGTEVLLEAELTMHEDSLSSVSWSPDVFELCPACLTQTVLATETQVYAIEVKDKRGCTARDQVYIRVEQEVPVFMGNAFSPNGDGQNDIFYVQTGAGVEEVLSFQMFDRWGELVFEHRNFHANDPEFGWDGYHKGRQMNPQVFVYRLELRLANGKVLVVSGDVVLIR